MKSQHSDSFNPVSIISLLSGFKWACDTDRVQGGATLWLLHLFFKCFTSVALMHLIELQCKSHKRRAEGTVTSNR